MLTQNQVWWADQDDSTRITTKTEGSHMNREPTPLKYIDVWKPTRWRHIQVHQQNVNKLLISQLDLLVSLRRNTYDICTIQEPYIDFNGKSQANWQWITVYPMLRQKRWPDWGLNPGPPGHIPVGLTSWAIRSYWIQVGRSDMLYSRLQVLIATASRHHIWLLCPSRTTI